MLNRRTAALAVALAVTIPPVHGSALAQDPFRLPDRAAAARSEQRQSGDVSSEITTLGASKVSGDPYLVEGTATFEGNLLITTKLIFKPNSRLVLMGGKSEDAVRIRADEIVVEGNSAGIFWNRAQAPTTTPVERGKAPSGTYGRGPGAPGGAGLDGEPGNSGISGDDSGDVVLAFKAITGGVLNVDLRGSGGGPGGRGQDGGDGGDGAQGQPALGSLFGCKAGPGRGGDGGDGGGAGPGGTGGAGGAGGTLILLTPDIETAQRQIKVFNEGGPGGPGGEPGSPGAGGDPGAEGPAVPPFCRPSSRNGREGAPGAPAAGPGPRGPLGPNGSYFTVPLSSTLAAQIFPPVARME